MPTRTAFIITIGDVLETGPPRASRSSTTTPAAASTASTTPNSHPKTLPNHPSSQSGLDDSDDSSRPASPASSTYSDAPRPRRFRKKHRGNMKTRVSNTGGLSDSCSISGSAHPTGSEAVVNGTNGGSSKDVIEAGSNGRRSRLQSVDQVYINNTNNNPLSPRTRSAVKEEVDDEVTFVDPLSNADSATCNGENGHIKDDPEDALSSSPNPNHPETETSTGNKKKRKSSAEKFLEDNTEYYGFQVLPSKLRSSSCSSTSIPSSNDSFPNPFLEYLHRSNGSPDPKADQPDPKADQTDPKADQNDHPEQCDVENCDAKIEAIGEPASRSGIRGGADRNNSIDHDEKSIPRSRTTSHSDLLDLNSGGHKSDGGRSRHSSGASGTAKRRIRANSSSSNHNEFIATKKLRVEVTKLDLSDHSAASSADELMDAYERSQRKKLRSLRSSSGSGNGTAETTTENATADKENEISAETSTVSPSSKKRRSELDKLLEAGLSSFHCESARQAADRLGLGPLKVDVSDNNSEAGSTTGAANEASSSRLLQEADVNQNSKKRPGTTGRPKKFKKRGRKRRSAANEAPEDEEEEEEEDDNESPMSSPYGVTDDLLESMLGKVDGEEMEIAKMEYSFEKTPFLESWFQTYSRQDQGDEVLHYPEYISFPLPYEMPMNTFTYQKKIIGNKEGKNGSSKLGTPGASGTATPTEEEPLPPEEPVVQRATRGNKNNSTKKTQHETPSGVLDKLCPKTKAALKNADLSRKSPRGHASTKSFMNHASPYVDDMDEEAFEELLKADANLIKNLAYLDECSNDSTFSSLNAQHHLENEAKLAEIANRLDVFFCEDDPVLNPQPSENPTSTKRSRRQSSSDKILNGTSNHKKSKKSKENENSIDKLIDSNVDPMFLDCLEEELPSVTFDDQPKDTLDLINTYDKCSSINLLGRKKKRSLPNLQNPEDNSRRSVPNLEDSNSENLVICHSSDPQSTILRRLLINNRKSTGKKVVNKKSPKKTSTTPKAEPNDSSSECNSNVETASIDEEITRKRKRSGATRFPSPKKTKKGVIQPQLRSPRLTSPKIVAQKGNSSAVKKKTSPATLRAARDKVNKAKKTAISNTRNGSKSVQLRLNLGKNGLSLRKPDQQPGKQPKRGRPAPASPVISPRIRAATNTKKSKVVKKGQKGRNFPGPSPPPTLNTGALKVKTIDVVDIPSSDEDPDDDDDDHNFRPGNGKKKGRKRRRKNKKKRSLNVKHTKKLYFVPKVITIDSDDEEQSEDGDEEEVDVDVSEDDSVQDDSNECTDQDQSADDEEESEAKESSESDEDKPIRPAILAKSKRKERLKKKPSGRSLRKKRKT